MSVAYLNGQFLPLERARISPMDRGFLFGDGIYEVIPTYDGRLVGFDLHIDRLFKGLDEIRIPNPHAADAWRHLFGELLSQNGEGNRAIYLQVTRGVVAKRQHRFPDSPEPTVFAYTFPLEAPSDGRPETARCWQVSTGEDLRWQRRHIKSTALLGNVLHLMEGVDAGGDEVLLFNADSELTEAAACNVFIVKDGAVATPSLDHEKLAGVTRQLMLDMMRAEGDWLVEERPVTKNEVFAADEVWLSSSTKEMEPVTMIDGRPVGAGEPGPVWCRAQSLFNRRRFDF